MKEINKKPNLCSINNVKGWTEAKKTKGSQICGCHCILYLLYSDNLLLIPHTRGQILFAGAWKTSDGRVIAEEINDYLVSCAGRGANPKLIGLTKSDHRDHSEVRSRFDQGVICMSRGRADSHGARAGKFREEAGKQNP